MFNALLVTLVEHGMTPQAIASRLISICSPEAMQASVAAGLLGVGSVFAGGSEQIARMLQTAFDGKDASADVEAIAHGHRRGSSSPRKAPIPGIGHPLHKPIDPRTPVLFAIAEKNGFRGRYVALLEAICATAEKRLTRSAADQRHRRDRRGAERTWVSLAHLPRRRDHRPCGRPGRSHRRGDAQPDRL